MDDVWTRLGEEIGILTRSQKDIQTEIGKEILIKAIKFWFKKITYYSINTNCLLHHSNLPQFCLDLTAPSLPAKLPGAKEAQRLNTEDRIINHICHVVFCIVSCGFVCSFVCTCKLMVDRFFRLNPDPYQKGNTQVILHACFLQLNITFFRNTNDKFFGYDKNSIGRNVSRSLGR